MKLKQKSETGKKRETTFLKGPKLGSLGVFVFGIPGFSPVRTGGLQGCQCCQGSGCALRNTNPLTHRAGDRQRSATSRKCFQVENSVLFFTTFSFRMRRPFFLLFLCFLFYFFFCFLCWPEKLENQLWFSCFFTCSFFCCFRIPYSVFLLHSKRLVCLFLLRCFVLFYFAPSICRPLFSPIFYITTPFIISFAKHSHTQLAVLLPLAPCLFFATFPLCFEGGRGEVGYIYWAYYLLVSFRYMKLYVCAYRRQFSRSFNLIY